MSQRVSPAGTGCVLPASPVVSAEFRKRITGCYDCFATDGLPENLEDFLLNEFKLDVSTEYPGLPIRNPWGKASGQLSMNAGQVREDVEAELGFVVLKTVIAQDETGEQSMDAWAIREARMQVERITGKLTGQAGWTVTWKGRGWWQPFEEYLALIRDARQIAGEQEPSREGTLIVPSCKYHLPAPGETTWKTAEYEYSTQRFLEAWGASATDIMPLEKDFSPTLAGSDLASAREPILEWLRQVPALIRDGAASQQDSLRVGLKVFNAMFADEFQLELLSLIHEAARENRPDFFVYGNRLFDPDWEFDGKRGVAYGGPDLSDRNLRVMSAFAEEHPETVLPWSATGDIGTGKMAVEYALRGATSFQLHTFFQLPADQYLMKTGSRTQRALHELYFHPDSGFVVWAEHLRQESQHDGPVRIPEFASFRGK
ncbi:MAG: hypothetical protein H8E37_08010 [Planctomycetes bacterium]|nr:hypothetical protein [Planctomycetota bacterium]